MLDKEDGWDVDSGQSGLYLKRIPLEEWPGSMTEAGGRGEVTPAYTIRLSKTRNVWHMHARQMFKHRVYRNQNMLVQPWLFHQ